MPKYSKIVVAVDGSETSRHALRESFKLAANEKSWITVVSVVPPYQGDLDMTGVGNVLAAMRRPAEASLQDAHEIAKAERALIRTVRDEGEIHERILDLADAENCDVIIMGRRGLGSVEKALVGSVTARVIGYGNKDVLVVPRDAGIGFGKILVATDGSRHSAIAVDHAIDFANAYGGKLTVASIVDVPAELYGEAPQLVENLVEKAKNLVEDSAQKARAAHVSCETVVKESEAYRAIVDIAKKRETNIIVMGSHGRTGLRRLLMGSVTEKVIGHAHCPVLVVKT